jgi:hypothetical protein
MHIVSGIAYACRRGCDGMVQMDYRDVCGQCIGSAWADRRRSAAAHMSSSNLYHFCRSVYHFVCITFVDRRNRRSVESRGPCECLGLFYMLYLSDTMLNIMHSGHCGSGYVTCKGDTEYHFLILVLREQPLISPKELAQIFFAACGCDSCEA